MALYSIEFKATVAPVDLLEGNEGLMHITDFHEMIPFTLRALLKGYKCTDDMLDRIENESSMLTPYFFPVEFYITYNPHCFAACLTNTTKSLNLGSLGEVLEQVEIMDLVESLPGSFKRAGTYNNLKRVSQSQKSIKLKTFVYEAPIFDTDLRYLALVKYKQVVGTMESSRCLMVLYIPK